MWSLNLLYGVRGMYKNTPVLRWTREISCGDKGYFGKRFATCPAINPVKAPVTHPATIRNG